MRYVKETLEVDQQIFYVHIFMNDLTEIQKNNLYKSHKNIDFSISFYLCVKILIRY